MKGSRGRPSDLLGPCSHAHKALKRCRDVGKAPPPGGQVTRARDYSVRRGRGTIGNLDAACDTALDSQARELLACMTPDERLRMLAGELDLYRDLVLGSAKKPVREKRRRHRGTARATDAERGESLPEAATDRSLPAPAYSPPLWRAASLPRLGLPGLVFVDGPRGVARGVATCFPVPIARAASFDYDLEERVGEAIGREAHAAGANVCLAPCLNLLRHPGWGRAQETYGENSEHIGEMGAAFVRGLQRHVLGCAKHFACNSIENSRFKVDVRVEPGVLESVYLPHFRRVVAEGVAAVMAAYNAVNGEWCGQNRHLLTTILKEKWGFSGFVVSDWLFGIRDGVAALQAGLDLEMPCRLFINQRVARAVADGMLPQSRVDDAALRLIRAQLRAARLDSAQWQAEGEFGASPAGDEYEPDVLACPEHRPLAREAATKGIVLLRNELVPAAAPGAQTATHPVLPLDPRNLGRLAVIGRLAAVPNTGDHGSSRVTAPYVVTPLAGLRAALEPHGCQVLYEDGAIPQRAADMAAAADAAIVVVGYDYRDEGEYLGSLPPPGFKRLLPRPPLSLLPRLLVAALALRHEEDSPLAGGGDRRSLTLHPEDEDLIIRVAAVNPRTVVVLMCGSAVIMERWHNVVPAIVVLWYPGMEGGHALADIVLGHVRPTGRLPVTIPRSADHLPPFDPDAETVEYGPLHGQAWLDHLGVSAAYPYGFGLTYPG